jgi:hypothetical protein
VTLMHAHGFLMPDDDGPDDVEYLTTTPTHDPAEVPAEVPGTADGGERHACDECQECLHDGYKCCGCWRDWRCTRSAPHPPTTRRHRPASGGRDADSGDRLTGLG